MFTSFSFTRTVNYTFIFLSPLCRLRKTKLLSNLACPLNQNNNKGSGIRLLYNSTIPFCNRQHFLEVSMLLKEESRLMQPHTLFMALF
ncbi:hypothetical protein N7G274_002050 [Stereocaulon virgatum]|uniref:Uncharacterized protein n=1 Tax=Stereocaulon virgatum TaxID=373712 RepID=A0ABR4AIM1_9LECA